MATTIPELSTLTSAADVFSGGYTLPQIRSIHKSLHVEIEEKSARLRTQVGNSYRELLGTADTIVHMQDDNERIQEILGRMGGRCGRTVISAKAAGLSKFISRRPNPAMRETARLELLELCGLMVGRVLKGGGMLDTQIKRGDRLVLATKIFVISRLLVKNLKEEQLSERAQRVVDAASKTSETLRRRIQRHIERLLESTDATTDTEDVVKALCANSLVNSSGSKNTIRHFIRVRQRAMEVALDLDEDTERALSADDVVHSLTLYTATLLDVQALVPVRLSQALSSLKGRKLLADPSLKSLEGLRLDMYEQWCSEEIQDFTPFIRHDDLDAKEARDMLGGFAEKGLQIVASGLKSTLSHMVDFKSITDLRTRVLQLWIRDGGRARGLDPQETQDVLREVINARLLDVVETKAAKLRLVGSEMTATLEGWQGGVSDAHVSFWDDNGYDEALANGAEPFIREVVSRLHGRNDAVSKAVNSYKSWYHIIDDVKTVVEELRKQRWDNDYDEIEDEETIEARQKMLSREDPKKLQDKLNEMLDQSFDKLAEHIQELWRQHAEHSCSGRMAIYLIRVLRDIRAQLPDRPSVTDFGLSMVPSLHSQIAAMAFEAPLRELTSSGLSDRHVVTLPLWEGDPALPTQPSPCIFMFLRDLSLSMSDLGTDLWTPAAMGKLKRQLARELCSAWHKQLETLAQTAPAEKKNADNDSGEAEGEEEADEQAQPDSTAAEICTQWLFDVALLKCCVGKAGAGKGEDDETDASHLYVKLEAGIFAQSGVDQDAKKRLGKSAQDFWGRVSLLFGMLA